MSADSDRDIDSFSPALGSPLWTQRLLTNLGRQLPESLVLCLTCSYQVWQLIALVGFEGLEIPARLRNTAKYYKHLPLDSSESSRHAHRTPPQSNSLGATIFVTYILLALGLTGYILRMIHKRATRLSNVPLAVSKSVKAMTACAFVSFTVLSWHMLSFLIYSYQAWSVAADTGHLKTGSLLFDIWQWMTTSSLFLDFARSLCATQGSFWWSQQALFGTLLTYVFINSFREILKNTRSWPFMLLAQILPISFSMNLFFIYILLDPEMPERAEVLQRTMARRHQTTMTAVRQIVGTALNLTVFTVVYIGVLNKLPTLTKDDDFIRYIVLTRFLLTISYLTIVPSDLFFNRFITLSMVETSGIALAFCAVGHALGQPAFLKFRFNSAVETFRWDFIIWTISINIWLWYVIIGEKKWKGGPSIEVMHETDVKDTSVEAK